MQLRKAEKEELCALLEQGAETPEALVNDFVKTLDAQRSQRSHYFACMLVAGFPLAIGPFSTSGQAAKAAQKMPAEKAWVVPGWTSEGWHVHLGEVDAAPAPFQLTKAAALKRDRGFWSRVSAIRDDEVTAIEGRDVEIKPLKLPKGVW